MSWFEGVNDLKAWRLDIVGAPSVGVADFVDGNAGVDRGAGGGGESGVSEWGTEPADCFSCVLTNCL